MVFVMRVDGGTVMVCFCWMALFGVLVVFLCLVCLCGFLRLCFIGLVCLI